MKEKWRKIKGYERLYEISNLGRVKSYYGRKNMLKNQKMNNGYYCVNLAKNKKHTVILIHRLVGKAFIPNPLNKPEINHKNGIKIDNAVNNLEWVTHKENAIHASKNNLMAKGEEHGITKLNELQVRIIKRLTGDINGKEIASIFSISRSTVHNVLLGKTWGHI